MNPADTLTFSVEKEHNRIRIQREYAAPRQLVWAAWTTADLLDQWWAPAPWRSHTKSMDFTEGGSRIYAMRGPGGEVHWGRTDYESIHPQESFSGQDGFSDENGELNSDLPQSSWVNTFTERGESNTLLTVETTYPSARDLEATLEMGFREGFTACLDQLEALLKESYR
ncbi:SRPBCC family protein [Neolewinella litorea]|uniref:SRPBCC domain-containing protein n=1 Tax=Neolewinella litorea TaxID=2562452 RepID=A0A4S4NE96_9BACT|nr:SRPBCC domain-containing protein [Neolewinella litorea]THH37852.1 SRPBCC domain-containing protein [Neolewinella litorea]